LKLDHLFLTVSDIKYSALCIVPQTAYASQIQVHKLLVSCLWRTR